MLGCYPGRAQFAVRYLEQYEIIGYRYSGIHEVPLELRCDVMTQWKGYTASPPPDIWSCSQKVNQCDRSSKQGRVAIFMFPGAGMQSSSHQSETDILQTWHGTARKNMFSQKPSSAVQCAHHACMQMQNQRPHIPILWWSERVRKKGWNRPHCMHLPTCMCDLFVARCDDVHEVREDCYSRG